MLVDRFLDTRSADFFGGYSWIFLAVCAGGRCWWGRPHPPPCTLGAWWACPAWAPPSSPSPSPGSAPVSDIKPCGTRSTTSGSPYSSTLVRYRLPSKGTKSAKANLIGLLAYNCGLPVNTMPCSFFLWLSMCLEKFQHPQQCCGS
jgi:hypothetical protein